MENALSYNESRLNKLAYKFNYLEKLIDIRKNQIEIKLGEKNIYSAYSLKNDDEVELVFSDGSLKARIIHG